MGANNVDRPTAQRDTPEHDAALKLAELNSDDSINMTPEVGSRPAERVTFVRKGQILRINHVIHTRLLEKFIVNLGATEARWSGELRKRTEGPLAKLRAKSGDRLGTGHLTCGQCEAIFHNVVHTTMYWHKYEEKFINAMALTN